MRMWTPVVILLLLLGPNQVLAVTDPARPWLQGCAPIAGEAVDDRPLHERGTGARADTVWYGSFEIIGGDYYAIPGDTKSEVMWTFDRGNGPFGDPDRIEGGEGWRAIDLTANAETFFRVIDATLRLGGGIAAPILSGAQSLWVGADSAQASSLCWECGAGYGNSWNQRVVSEPLAFDGTGDVTIQFLYFQDSEECYDATQVYLQREDGSELLLNEDLTCGVVEEPFGFNEIIGSPGAPVTFETTIPSGEIGGVQPIRFVFEFTSDGGWSDQDCEYQTAYGPFAVDDIAITGGGIDVAYDFEDGLQGWEPEIGEAIGSYAGVAPYTDYTIDDDCDCRLEGNVLEMHAGSGDVGYHVLHQLERVESPICSLGPGGGRDLFFEFDMFGWIPDNDVLLIRPGWRYYPWVCEATGMVGWSPRVGQTSYYQMSGSPTCSTWRFGGIEGPPPDAEKVMAVIDLWYPSNIFGLRLRDSNFSPIFDNLAVGVAVAAGGPIIALSTGASFQDVGSYPSSLFDPRGEGPANVEYDLYFSSPPDQDPHVCGDTLTVTGPIPGSDPNTRWEAKLWFRVAKRGPFQTEQESGVDTRYKIWRNRVADGLAIDRPDNPPFAWAWMDSVQVGSIVKRNEFLSEFREDDDDFVGENTEENEILWDDCFRPGTRIEYFITSNYVVTPNQLFSLPDTSGGYFYEFEILPGIRTARVPDCGGTGFDYCVYQPATLYVDAFNRGAQVYIENALAHVLDGRPLCQEESGCAIPQDRNWDRYDYLGSCACWSAPFARGVVVGSNNGMTLDQILGYRTILVNTGSAGAGTMSDFDFGLFDDWLISPSCNANLNRQLFMINGDHAGEVVADPSDGYYGQGLAFLQNRLSADVTCVAFNGRTGDPECGAENESYCVRWLAADGGAFPTAIDVDAFGNACPSAFGFNVYAPRVDAVGNRTYEAEDGLKEMSYAQIVHEDLAVDANYRAVLDGVSWHHMTSRVGPGGDGTDAWCPRDLPSIVEAAAREIGEAMKWGFNAPDYESIPTLASAQELAECQGTWHLGGADAEEPLGFTPVNRLYPNQPNPFNPITTIRFSLAVAGPVEIVIYDVGGRAIRRLVDEAREAGLHAIVWDGKNDEGLPVGSGIYWCRMKTRAFESNKQMVVLK